jgi:hypothetical protein
MYKSASRNRQRRRWGNRMKYFMPGDSPIARIDRIRQRLMSNTMRLVENDATENTPTPRIQKHSQEERDWLSRANRILSEAATGDPREAKSQIKLAHQELKKPYFNKAFFRAIYSILEEAWQVADERYCIETQRRRGEWQSRTHDNIQRWRTMIETNERQIDQIENEIEDSFKMQQYAKEMSYSEMPAVAIERKKERIAYLKSRNEEIKGRIRLALQKISSEA